MVKIQEKKFLLYVPKFFLELTDAMLTTGLRDLIKAP